MKKIFTLALVCLSAWTAAMAVPAKPGVRALKQADGTTIHVQLAGDEWHHSYVTSEGYAVSRNDDGNFYYRTTNGISTVQAHDAANRTAAEKQFIAANSDQMTLQSLFTDTQSARRSKALVARKASQVPQTGAPHVPVILVNYKDKKFVSSDPVTVWKQQISNPNEVSVYQYFVDQSFGKYTPQFDILGPVTLANNRSTYGGNDYSGNDKGVGKMVAEACQLLPTSVDWTKYDNDGDGVVDVVIVLYAGDGEASSYASDAANAVWPCQWDLASSDYGKNISLDSKTISKFAVFNEVNGSDRTKIDGIGTFCHEFSHCLDLPDFYCTNYGNYFGMGSWSLMDFGSYNNDGYTPCGYTGYEREFMGWYKMPTPNEGDKITTQPVANGGTAYKIPTPNANEYFVVENIQKTGWNKYAPAAGLQITHVTYNATKWINNTVNNSNPQCMTIMPADNNLKMTYSYGSYYLDEANEVGDLYPYNGNNEFTATSKPAAKLNNTTGYLDKPITEITQNTDGSISFYYVKGSEPEPVYDTPVATAATEVGNAGFTANWSACDGALSYILKVKAKGAYENILSESFAKCTTAGSSNVGSSLNTYMDNTGWTGSNVFTEEGGLRLSSSKNAGTLTSPALNLTNSGGVMTAVIKAKAYSSDTNCTLTMKLGSTTKTITCADDNEGTYVVTFDCEENATQKLAFSTVAKKRIVITGLDIYSGDASDLASAPAKAASETRTGNEILVTGITGTSYAVTGLEASSDYTYTVKAVYADADESEWSNLIKVTTTSAPVAKTGDVNNDGAVDVVDINCILGILMNGVPVSTYEGRADVSGDGLVDVADINAIIGIMIQ